MGVDLVGVDFMRVDLVGGHQHSTSGGGETINTVQQWNLPVNMSVWEELQITKIKLT